MRKAHDLTFGRRHVMITFIDLHCHIEQLIRTIFIDQSFAMPELCMLACMYIFFFLLRLMDILLHSEVLGFFTVIVCSEAEVVLSFEEVIVDLAVVDINVNFFTVDFKISGDFVNVLILVVD